MRITISKTANPASVYILHLEGKLDRANYESLIDEAQEIYGFGARDLVLDMSKLTYISSAGVSALHQVALLFREEKGSPLEGGWDSFHSGLDDNPLVAQEHVKLFSPPGEVLAVLNMAGFGSLFDIYTDLTQAVASFRRLIPERMDDR